jgi:hypothetical protein
MRITARLLTPIVCAAALTVVPAHSAHANATDAGCIDDLVAALQPSPIGISVVPDRYVEVNGIDIAVYTSNVVNDGFAITYAVYGRVLTLVFATPGALLQFVDCVK